MARRRVWICSGSKSRALKTRYRAELGADDSESAVIELIPTKSGGEIRTASIELDRGDPAPAPLRLRALSYEDP